MKCRLEKVLDILENTFDISFEECIPTVQDGYLAGICDTIDLCVGIIGQEIGFNKETMKAVDRMYGVKGKATAISPNANKLYENVDRYKDNDK